MKGHVPDRDLGPYRYWRDRHREADRLGSVLSGLGRYDLANAMWSAAAVLKEKADSYRVELSDG